MTYHIYYNGAPYGDDEKGHVVSSHKTLGNALKKQNKLEREGRYYNNTHIRDANDHTLDIYDIEEILSEEVKRGITAI